MYCNEFTIIHLWMTLPWYTCYTSYACISSMISIPCSMKRTKMIKDAFWGAVQSLSKAPHIKAMWKSKCFGMHRMNRISAWPIVTPLLDVTRCSYRSCRSSPHLGTWVDLEVTLWLQKVNVIYVSRFFGSKPRISPLWLHHSFLGNLINISYANNMQIIAGNVPAVLIFRIKSAPVLLTVQDSALDLSWPTELQKGCSSLN